VRMYSVSPAKAMETMLSCWSASALPKRLVRGFASARAAGSAGISKQKASSSAASLKAAFPPGLTGMDACFMFSSLFPDGVCIFYQLDNTGMYGAKPGMSIGEPLVCVNLITVLLLVFYKLVTYVFLPHQKTRVVRLFLLFDAWEAAFVAQSRRRGRTLMGQFCPGCPQSAARA